MSRSETNVQERFDFQFSEKKQYFNNTLLNSDNLAIKQIFIEKTF